MLLNAALYTTRVGFAATPSLVFQPARDAPSRWSAKVPVVETVHATCAHCPAGGKKRSAGSKPRSVLPYGVVKGLAEEGEIDRVGADWR